MVLRQTVKADFICRSQIDLERGYVVASAGFATVLVPRQQNISHGGDCVNKRHRTASLFTGGILVLAALVTAVICTGCAISSSGSTDIAGLQQQLHHHPDDSAARLKLVRAQLEQGQIEAARQQLQPLLEMPNPPLAARVLDADIIYAGGDVPRATLLLHRLLDEHPDDESLYLRLVTLYINDVDIAQATAVLHQLLQHNPDSVQGLMYMAQVSRLQHDYPAAIKYYQRVIQVQPDKARPYAELGQVLELSKQAEQALDVYSQAARNSDQPLYFIHQRTSLLLQYQRYDEAEQELLTALDKYPNDADSRYKYAYILCERCRWSEAERQFRLAIKAGFALQQVHYWLGVAYEKQQKWSAAELEYRKILADPHWGYNARRRLGVVLFYQQRYAEAVAEHKKLYIGADTRPMWYLQLALYYQAWGKEQQVLEILNEGLKKYPADADLRYARGVYYQMHGNRAKVIEDMRSVLQSDGNHYGALNHLAYLYAEQGEHLDEALDMARRAVAINPAAAVLDTLGWVYYQRGDYRKACDYLRKSLKKDAGDATVLEHLGDACAAMGNYAAARSSYAKALQLAPNNAAVKAKMEKLP